MQIHSRLPCSWAMGGPKHLGNLVKYSQALPAGLLTAVDRLMEVAVPGGSVSHLWCWKPLSESRWLIEGPPVSPPQFTPFLHPEGAKFLFRHLTLSVPGSNPPPPALPDHSRVWGCPPWKPTLNTCHAILRRWFILCAFGGHEVFLN